MDKVSMVVSSTMHDMIDNSIRSNSALQKAQRKEDKDKNKKTTESTATSSKGVGINAGSVGDQDDMSNMGDNRGRNTSNEDMFSSQQKDHHGEDTGELDPSLNFFSKDKVYSSKMQKPAQEQLCLTDEEKEEASVKKDSNHREDRGLEDIKDGKGKDKISLSRNEKDLIEADPKHRLKDKYTSTEEEEKKTKKEDTHQEDILLPQMKIQSSSITMEIPEETPLDIERDEEKEVIFNTPSLYKIEDIEEADVPDKIRNSPEYIREQKNRERVIKMLVHCPHINIAKSLVNKLYLLGEKILETCLNFGIKIVVLKPGERLSNITKIPDNTGDLRAGYSENLKVCFLGEEWLYEDFEDLYRFNTIVYLMAIAFDHATGGDSFASLKSPFVLNNYHACRRGEEGHQFLEGIASYGPVEYFAQTLESFLQEKDKSLGIDLAQKVFEGKICSNDELYYTDMSMYQYIDYLVNS